TEGSSVGIPHSAGHLGGSYHALVFPGCEAGGLGTQSGPQPGKLDNLLGVTSEGGETSNSAGELEAPTPAECTGDREQAVPLSGDCLTGEAHLEGPSNSADEEVEEESTPRLRPRDRTREVSAPSRPTDPVVPPNLTCLEPALLIKGQQGDPELAPCFAKVGKEIRGMEEFRRQKGVLPRRSGESDNNEVLQVVVPRELREALVLLAHVGPRAGHLVVGQTLARLWGNFWWPGMARDIMELVKGCHTCQMVGKPNRIPPMAPLHPIPAVDPFTRVQNQLVFGHRVRGPLDLAREAWSAPHSDRPESPSKSELSTREGLVKALEVAPHHLGAASKKRRRYYDPKVKYYDFAPGEETTEVPGSELVVPAEHWGQCGVLLRERLQYLEGEQKKKFHCQSEGVITGVKPRDKREGSVYSIWSFNRDQIEEPLNAPPTKHFDTSAEIQEQAPEAGVNAAEAEVHPGCTKGLLPRDFQSENSYGRGRGHGRGKGVLGKSARGRFLSWTVPGNRPVSWSRGPRRWWPTAC
ncbi:hypothetical protein ECANGB1_1293, partial [Enterospora canceri]